MATHVDIIAGNVPPEQDYILLGGMRSPGRATISGLTLPRKWEERQPYGHSGAETHWRGEGLIRFDVTIDLWLPEHWGEWNRFAKVMFVKAPIGAKMALDIAHPLLALEPIKVTSVVVEDVTQFEQSEEGLWSCTIKFLQYRKPQDALGGKVDASIPNVDKPKPTAQDAAELEIQKLLAQVNTLAGP